MSDRAPVHFYPANRDADPAFTPSAAAPSRCSVQALLLQCLHLSA